MPESGSHPLFSSNISGLFICGNLLTVCDRAANLPPKVFGGVRTLRERAFLKMIFIESLEEEPSNVDCFTALIMTQKIK
jgi:hypothetical protein